MSLKAFLIKSYVALLLVLCILATTRVVEAQDPQPHDWRRGLDCDPTIQTFDGLLLCKGTAKAKDQNSNPLDVPVFVLVADLSSPGLHFEYLIPKGYRASDPVSERELAECDDVNRFPDRPRGGCVAADGLYPVMDMTEAIVRAKEIRPNHDLAAIINTDYRAHNRNHGPEGLTVIRGTRIDGYANARDDDFNGGLRPWLGLGATRDETTGLLQAAIDYLPTDDGPIPEWMYTGVGGGPWLIREGNVYRDAKYCKGTKSLETPLGTKIESYDPNSCRYTAHTAAGISKDKRWLFLVIATAGRPDVIANFMHEQLGAWNALKFDGGGSSQLWYAGAPNPEVYPSSRRLSSFLGLYASPGKGIYLPLDAAPAERVFYAVVNSGETARLELEVANNGPFTWYPEDGVELRWEPWFFISPVVESLPLAGPVAPGETALWTYELTTSLIATQRFQMYQKGKPFGEEFAVIVVTVPKGLEERREEIEERIQELIEKWKERGITFFKGTPFLTGVGVEPIMQQLIELLDSWGVQS